MPINDLNTIGCVDDILSKTQHFVYTEYLAKPFSDSGQYRGSYQDENGTEREYSEYQLSTQSIRGAVYRPNHGLAHNVRVAFKVRDVVSLYVNPECNTNADSRKFFEALNTEEAKIKLEIAASFFVACRESEAGFQPNENSPYQQYRAASSKAFFDYAKNIKKSDGTLLFLEEELELYASVLKNVYFEENDKEAFKSKDESAGKKAALKAVLSSCHALDLARCFEAQKMRGKIEEVLHPLDCETDVARKKVCDLFILSEIEHILTGTESFCKLSQDSFIAKKSPARVFLFQISNTDPDIAMRLIALSRKIVDVEVANKLAIILNHYARYAMQDPGNFITIIEKMEKDLNSSPSLFEKNLEEMFNVLRESENGFIYKVIRAREQDYWDMFAQEIVNPGIQKPELRNSAKRKKYTLKLKNGEYALVPTNKVEKQTIAGEEYNELDKKTFTRHQSASFANYPIGYIPKPFNHDAMSGVQPLLVGVSFLPQECQLKRIMLYDSSYATIDRPYDFETLAENESSLFSRRLYKSLRDLQDRELSSNSKKTNEVMAKLKWTKNVSITVFSNNLESRLLAQLRAKDLESRLKAKYPNENIFVPINIYPALTLYSESYQQEDRERALKNPSEKKYVVALNLLSGQSDLFQMILNSKENVVTEEIITGAFKLANQVNSNFINQLNLQNLVSHFSSSAKNLSILLSCLTQEQISKILLILPDNWFATHLKSQEDFLFFKKQLPFLFERVDYIKKWVKINGNSDILTYIATVTTDENIFHSISIHETCDEKTELALVKNQYLPAAILEKIASNSKNKETLSAVMENLYFNAKIKMAIIKNPSIETDLFQKLAMEVFRLDSECCSMILESEKCNSEMMLKIAQNESTKSKNLHKIALNAQEDEILLAVLCNKNCDDATKILVITRAKIGISSELENIVKETTDSDVLIAVLEHSSCDKEAILIEVLNRLSSYNKKISDLILSHKMFNERVKEEYAKFLRKLKPDDLLRVASTTTDQAVLIEIFNLSSKDLDILLAVCKKISCVSVISKILDFCSEDSENEDMQDIVIQICCNPSVSKEVLVRVLNSDILNSEILKALVSHQNCDAEVFLEVIKNETRIVSSFVLILILRQIKNTDMLNMIFQRLLAHPNCDDDVVNALIENENITDDILKFILSTTMDALLLRNSIMKFSTINDDIIDVLFKNPHIKVMDKNTVRVLSEKINSDPTKTDSEKNDLILKIRNLQINSLAASEYNTSLPRLF